MICIPVEDDHPNYRTYDLMDQPMCCISSVDRADGNYDLFWNLQRKGMFSVGIQSLELGGLLGQYWDNQWFYGRPIETRQDGRIDFQW